MFQEFWVTNVPCGEEPYHEVHFIVTIHYLNFAIILSIFTSTIMILISLLTKHEEKPGPFNCILNLVGTFFFQGHTVLLSIDKLLLIQLLKKFFMI